MAAEKRKHVTVVTHSETFHADEVTAVALFDLLFGVERIVRTRNQDQISELNEAGAYVVDVGKVFDHSKRLYDHHQLDFKDTFDDKTAFNMSSCGLVWKHYGKQLIEGFYQKHADRIVPTPTDVSGSGADDSPDSYPAIDVDDIYSRFYHGYLKAIDANDVGVDLVKKEFLRSKPLNFTPFSVGSVISSLNNNVDEPDNQDNQFAKAVALMKTVLTPLLTSSIKRNVKFLLDKPVFDTGFLSRDNPEILVLEKQINVDPHLKEQDPEQEVKLIVIPRGPTAWQLWTVNPPHDRFTPLVKVLGEKEARAALNEDLIFVHPNRFIGATKTKVSCVRLAELSLQAHVPKIDSVVPTEPSSIDLLPSLRDILLIGTGLTIAGISYVASRVLK